MKEKIFLIFMLIMAVMPCISKKEESIKLVQITNPFPDLGHEHRSICAPIYVTQHGHIFAFDEGLVGETIQIYDGDTLLYMAIISENGNVIIPIDINGKVELRLIRGNLTYRAVVEL